jgi:hypothetical protein
MVEVVGVSESVSRYIPWNKGKSSARNRPSVRSTSGPSERSSRSKIGSAIWLCSTWPSTASFEDATFLL